MKKEVKIKVKKRYFDKDLKKKIGEGDVLEISSQRARELLEAQRLNPNQFDFEVLKINKLS